MDEIKAKQQVVDKLKNLAKILVTVSDDPSVDALAAAMALTLLLDKQEKYATAIYSGSTPPAIRFLEPEKTFDDSTDSLRDFIIALNKEKADHLRYKVEGDAVKIFITPYKTTIDQSDLEFSQGDYNVELVIALGVDNPDHLDKALENHGQILHDATIITMTAGDQTSKLGGIDWHDGQASSLSEMVAGLAEALKDDKKKALIDAPIATALLTGIVAQTDRFSNEHTTSRVMTVAAQLMAAGADQQLIAAELQTANSDDQDDSPTDDTGPSDDQGGMSVKRGGLSISHEGETLAELDERVRGEDESQAKIDEERANPAPVHVADVAEEEPKVGETHAAYALPEEDTVEPSMGGTLNATTEQAAEDARREAASDQNKTILSHAYLGGDDSSTATPGAGNFGAPATPPGSTGVNDAPTSSGMSSAYALDTRAPDLAQEPAPAPEAAPPAPEQTNNLGERVIQPLSAAPTPIPTPDPVAPQPAATPTDLGLPLPPPLPDFSQMNGPAPALPVPPSPQPEILGDILAPEQPAAPAPEAPSPTSQLPNLDPNPQPPTPQPTDPAQFKIPGQQ